MSDFQAIINLGADVVVTKETFTPVITRLPDIVENWREENLEKLAQLVPLGAAMSKAKEKKGKEKEGCSTALSVLNLATCVFKCGSINCLEALPYQRLFHHRCLTSPPLQIGYESKSPSTEIYFNLGHVPHHHKKPFGGTTFADGGAKLAEIFVEMSGFDPKIATTDEMDGVDARFACQHCSKGGDWKVMSWRTAMNHQIILHCKDPPRWSKLNASDEARTKKLEEDFGHTPDLSTIWRCIKCINPSTSWGVYGYVNGYMRTISRPDVIQHLKAAHEIDDAKEGEHYFKEPDRPESNGIFPGEILKAV